MRNEIKIDNDALNYVIKEIFPIGCGMNVNITGINYRTFVQKGLYKVNYMFEKSNVERGFKNSFEFLLTLVNKRNVDIFCII